MNAYPNSVARMMTSDDAALLYPCFRFEDVERALDRMAYKLGFIRGEYIHLPHVFTYTAVDLKLMVMTTPKLFFLDRMCYAMSGVLIKKNEWTSEVTPLPAVSPESRTSMWRKHPRDFYLDILTAVEQLVPDRRLPASRTRLLGVANAECRMSNAECRMTNEECDAENSFGTRHSALGTRHSALGIRHSALGARHSSQGRRKVFSISAGSLIVR